MDFSHSYYVVSVSNNNETQDITFNNRTDALYYRRKKAIQCFFENAEQIKNKHSVKEYKIEFVLFKPGITRDFIDGDFFELDVFVSHVLFSITSEKSDIDYYQLSEEAKKADGNNDYLGNKVTVRDANDKQIYIYNDELCRKLQIDFEY